MVPGPMQPHGGNRFPVFHNVSPVLLLIVDVLGVQPLILTLLFQTCSVETCWRFWKRRGLIRLRWYASRWAEWQGCVSPWNIQGGLVLSCHVIHPWPSITLLCCPVSRTTLPEQGRPGWKSVR